jgi:ATP-dependent helicase HrpB
LGNEIDVREDVFFDEEREQFYSRRGRFLDDLPLDEPSLGPADPAIISERFTELFLERWQDILARDPKLKSWMERWSFAQAFDPKFELDSNVRRQFAQAATFGKVSLAEVLESDLVELLESVFDRQSLREFESAAPREFTAPSGFRHPIDYSEGHAVYVEVRLQEMFGLTQHPFVLNGRVPITFRLLGPNFRPVQVTSDIAGFWTGAYHEVRKELRARYPKHSWPEDPRTAKPEAKGSRRR